MARRRTGRRTTRARRSAGASAVRRTRSRPRVNPEQVLESIVDELVSRLGLDVLGLNRDEYKEMLRPVIEGILDQYSSRPSREALLSRLEHQAANLYVLASMYVLEKRERLNEDQLEFIVSNAPQVAAKYVSRLYEEAKRLGREDLIPLLRSAWERFGTPSPIPCPRCGFRAVTPDLVCMVCGYELSEREAKEMIDFGERLRELVEFYGPSAAREALTRGYVIVGETVKPPTEPPGPMDVVLHLDNRDREVLKRLLAEPRSRRG